VIVVMAGLPGTGKSTLGEAIAADFQGGVISKDRIRDAAFGALVDYSSAQDDFCMELVYRTVRYLRETRPEVILVIDGRTFSRRAQVSRLVEALLETPRWIECVCDDSVARRRLDAAPDHLARNRNYELYRGVKAAAEPLEVPRLTIDTGRVTLVEAVRRASEFLLSPPPDLARR
jgi:predicted kinase